MNLMILAARGLARDPRRTAATLLPVAAAFLLYGILAALVEAINLHHRIDAGAFSGGIAGATGITVAPHEIVSIARLAAAGVLAAMLLFAGVAIARTMHQRTREIALFRTMGYSTGRILMLVAAEAALIPLIGGALGLAGAALLLEIAAIATDPVDHGLGLSLLTLWGGWALCVIAALSTAMVSALTIWRLGTVPSH